MLHDLWNALLENWSTTLVAVFVAFVAWQQYRVARNRLKFDLFERRMKVYDASRKLAAVFKLKESLDRDFLPAFEYEVRNARWLLDVGITQYLEHELLKKALEFLAEDEKRRTFSGRRKIESYDRNARKSLMVSEAGSHH